MDKTAQGQELRSRLHFKSLETKKTFRDKFPYAPDLDNLREKSTKLLSTGTLAGALLLTPPNISPTLPSPQEVIARLFESEGKKTISIREPQILLMEALQDILPEKPRPLTRDEEKALEKTFSSIMGVPARATLEGEHLNTTYGLIGAEQHLYRYPGDTLENHGSGTVLKEGIAPGLGAWGYFSPVKEKLTKSLEETEKWYAVVQTLYLPDWNTRTRYLRDWYKYRKVLIVNTNNGNAVVAAIADSGPAAWTGKQYGGSPEVMDYLGGSRYKKGPVIVFFVDDPNNVVPLGPVEYNKINLAGVSFKQV